VTTIFERVSTALGTINPSVPFALAPYKTTGTLPDTYLSFQLIAGAPEQTADDAETERSYLIQVSIFSSERQLPQDPQTGHYGLAKEYVYV
jgi:hypothetical protein